MMQFSERLVLDGIPDTVKDEDKAIFKSRIFAAADKLQEAAGLQEIAITLGTPAMLKKEYAKRSHGGASKTSNDEATTEDRVAQYQVRKPLYTFDQLIVSHEILEDLLSAVETVRLIPLVFGQWGLQKIEPFPHSALNFHGPSGTGKTLAAHAIAHYLGQNILVASYAEIESKYVGDGPKNVKAVFLAAERNNAVLFIDEADSLLSKRLTSVTQGAEQAINSMRSQLLICLEQYIGVVIFATNLVANYDQAFETRVRHVRFSLPDEPSRAKIWETLLVPEIPLYNVSSLELARAVDDISGREIKNAIIDAAVRAARQKKEIIETNDLLDATQRIKASRIVHDKPALRPLSPVESVEIKQRINAAFSEKSNGKE